MESKRKIVERAGEEKEKRFLAVFSWSAPRNLFCVCLWIWLVMREKICFDNVDGGDALVGDQVSQQQPQTTVKETERVPFSSAVLRIRL